MPSGTICDITLLPMSYLTRFFTPRFQSFSHNLRDSQSLWSTLDTIDTVLGDLSNGYYSPQETDSSYTLTLAFPGFKKEEVTVEIKEDAYFAASSYLSITASRGGAKGVETRTNSGVVTPSNHVSRAITLPSDADPSKIEAKMEDGLLTLTIGKVIAAEPRKVVIS